MVFYLIEYIQKDHEQALWWTGLWFSKDIQEAARFPIKEHAETALDRLDTSADIDRSRLTVTEHVCMDNAHMFTVQLTRREIAHLPLETRRRILEQQVDRYLKK